MKRIRTPGAASATVRSNIGKVTTSPVGLSKRYELTFFVEGVSKRSRDQLFGRTEQNRVVVFDRGTHRVGDFVNVRVTEARWVNRL